MKKEKKLKSKKNPASKPLKNNFDFFKTELKKNIDEDNSEHLNLLIKGFDHLLLVQKTIDAYFSEDIQADDKKGILEAEKKTEKTMLKKERKKKEKNYKPIDAYRYPILKILTDYGGKAPVKDILKKLEEMFKDEFTEKDMMQLRANKEILWRHNAKICRSFMVRDGLLAKDAPWGSWVLTQRGREEFEKYLAEK